MWVTSAIVSAACLLLGAVMILAAFAKPKTPRPKSANEYYLRAKERAQQAESERSDRIAKLAVGTALLCWGIYSAVTAYSLASSDMNEHRARQQCEALAAELASRDDRPMSLRCE